LSQPPHYSKWYSLYWLLQMYRWSHRLHSCSWYAAVLPAMLKRRWCFSWCVVRRCSTWDICGVVPFDLVLFYQSVCYFTCIDISLGNSVGSLMLLLVAPAANVALDCSVP
jgi:hypothetical protein